VSAARVVVVVPNWNGGEDVLACLRSLSQVRTPEITVRSAHPSVYLIELGQNEGFTGAANAGIAFARREKADYCLLLNSDATIADDAIALLVDALDALPAAAAAGPTICYRDRPRVIWSAGGSIDWRRGSARMVGMDEADEGQFGTEPRSVPFVSGCAILLRMEAVSRFGTLDPRFFAYYEEVEWCVRCTRGGACIVYVPRAHAWHGITAEAREASPLVHYYMTRNHLLLLRSCHAPLSAWICALADTARTTFSWTVRSKWRHKRPQRAAVVRGLADFWAGRFGRAPLPGA
jgi:GT2 family glycosyltransferase